MCVAYTIYTVPFTIHHPLLFILNHLLVVGCWLIPVPTGYISFIHSGLKNIIAPPRKQYFSHIRDIFGENSFQWDTYRQFEATRKYFDSKIVLKKFWFTFSNLQNNNQLAVGRCIQILNLFCVASHLIPFKFLTLLVLNATRVACKRLPRQRNIFSYTVYVLTYSESPC